MGKNETLKIIYKSVSELTPYANNPRKNDAAVDAVAASIKEFGFKVPIVIDKKGTIAAGHTRLKAAKKLGLETVPCVIADDLTPEQIRAFRLADNKSAELAEWDEEKLAEELKELDEFDMLSFGFKDMLNLSEGDPDFQEAIKDTDNEVPASRVCIYTCSLFGKTTEKLFEFRLSEEEAQQILDRINAKPAEEAAEKIRGLINAI